MLHERFEWDKDKANENLVKHGVRFEEAAAVLADGSGGLTRMKQKADKTIRFDASRIRPPSAADRDRIERAAAGAIDTRDIAEVRVMKRHGPIWNAVADGMRRQGLTGHGLWKKAREFCPRMPESAVYEFLADKRSVRVEYADAMLQALGVRLVCSRRKRAG